MPILRTTNTLTHASIANYSLDMALRDLGAGPAWSLQEGAWGLQPSPRNG